MAKLSIILPSRDEKFLVPTIHDIFRNAKGECEVVAVLDSEKWPENWKLITDQYPNLHTIHHGKSRGMRAAINSGVASAIQRGAKWIMKSDAHCMFDEGFDLKLLETIEPNWIVIPRRKRLDADKWELTDTNKPDVDYHYLSFPDDPKDFGGAGLNGKIWVDRAIQRKDIMIDDEMSSQGSCWLTSAKYFQELELMDESSYGPFWNEMQECANKAWLSGGAVKINKNTWYAHLHKGKVHGRGYKLDEKWLTQGRNHTMLWPWNEAWSKQTLPFKWLIEHFWPVPSWPENWEEVLYATRKPRQISGWDLGGGDLMWESPLVSVSHLPLKIHAATYGVGAGLGLHSDLDVTERLQSLVNGDSLDIVVNNSTICPNENPYRGKKKKLWVTYSLNGGKTTTVERDEKDWLIIGPAVMNEGQRLLQYGRDLVSREKVLQAGAIGSDETARLISKRDGREDDVQPSQAKSNLADSNVGPLVTSLSQLPPMTAPALNDYLIRRFQISPQRLRGPMPIELRDFNRNDLAQLFAELGFKRGAEIGVAEGHYSEVLLKANPDLELLLVDPWHHYSDNPQGKSKERHEFSYQETLRKTKPYSNVKIDPRYSMDAVRDVQDGSLDAVYIDGAHSFNYVMTDLICWSGKVRSGGIIALDDYYFIDRKRWGAGVVEAVQAFTSAHQISPWFICGADRSVDAFWVKS